MIKTLYKGSDTMQVPEFDVSHWADQGWSNEPVKPTSAPQGATHIRDPKKLEGLTEDQIWRDPNSANIYQTKPTGDIPNETTPDALGSNMGDALPEPETFGGDIDALVSATEPTQKGLEELMKQQQAELKSQQEFDKTRKKEAQAGEENKTAGRDLQEKMWERFGLNQNVEQIQSLMPQIATAQAEFARMQEEVANQPISSRIIGGTQDRLRRQKSVELAGMSAMAQAYQGNVDMARTLTQDAINTKYKDQEYYINNLRQQMNYISQNLSREETTKLNSLKTVINERERKIAEAKEMETNIGNIMTTVAQAGADVGTLQAIMKSESYEDAIIAAKDYLQETPEGIVSLGDGKFLDTNSNTVVTADQLNQSVVIPQSSRIAYVHNNPGNLMFANQPGATKGEAKAGGGYWAYFNSAEAGYNALKKQIELDSSRGLTLEKFINKYAPPGENDTNEYLMQISQQLNLPINTPISQIDTETLAQFIAKKESGTTIRDITQTEELKESPIPGISDVEWSNYSEQEQKQLETAKKNYDKFRDKLLDDLASGKRDWGEAWDYMKNTYPNMSNQEIDEELRKWQFAPEAPTASTPTASTEQAPTGKQAGTKTGTMPELTASPDSFNWEGMGKQWEETKKYLGIK